MDIFVYADESGVFDRYHNDYFVFGGVIFLGKEQRDIARRRYISVERLQRSHGAAQGHSEMKAIYLKNSQKSSMFRSLNPYNRFGVIVDQKMVISQIFQNKKSKQRYLDFAFKLGLRSALEQLIRDGLVNQSGVNNIYVFMDEHSTATDGRYELREALEAEFKIGTYNDKWSKFFPPLFDNLCFVEFCLKDSAQDALIRAADITANRLYYAVVSNQLNLIEKKIIYRRLPHQ